MAIDVGDVRFRPGDTITLDQDGTVTGGEPVTFDANGNVTVAGADDDVIGQALNFLTDEAAEMDDALDKASVHVAGLVTVGEAGTGGVGAGDFVEGDGDGAFVDLDAGTLTNHPMALEDADAEDNFLVLWR